jgi:hypothetical protein
VGIAIRRHLLLLVLQVLTEMLLRGPRHLCVSRVLLDIGVLSKRRTLFWNLVCAPLLLRNHDNI